MEKKLQCQDDIEKGCHADIEMEFEGGNDKQSSKKASIDSESDSIQKKTRKRNSKSFKKRNLEGGEGSGESTKRNLLDPRFSKGEILRENTKKSGLKSFKEDKKKSGKKDKDIDKFKNESSK